MQRLVRVGLPLAVAAAGCTVAARLSALVLRHDDLVDEGSKPETGVGRHEVHESEPGDARVTHYVHLP